ncbi:hypothetical protein OIU78_013191 [Salix suchowensis]|nr:hypothetical protein OIU78_013191 [Salix suchowensis]
MAWETPASKDGKPVVNGSRPLIVYVSLVSTYQSALEMEIPDLVGDIDFKAILFLGIIAVISQVAWQVLTVSIPVIADCIWYQQYYISSARELSRLVGVCNALVIQNFAETISGATTMIRSSDQESIFQDTHMNAYSRPSFCNSAAMQWLCFRMDMINSITFAFCLAVAYALDLHMAQVELIWNFCNCENKPISVDRILQYMTIPDDPPLVIYQVFLVLEYQNEVEKSGATIEFLVLLLQQQETHVREASSSILVVQSVQNTLLGDRPPDELRSSR